MKKLFFIVAIFISVSAVMCANSEQECLYEGSVNTVQDVIRAEIDCLIQVVQASAQKHYSRPLLSEINFDHLPQGSLLKDRLQKRNELVQMIPDALNAQLMLNVGGIHNHFALKICRCDQCAAALKDDASHLFIRDELYKVFEDVYSNSNLKSPLLLDQMRSVLPKKGFWYGCIDQAIRDAGGNEPNLTVFLRAPSVRFHDPFADDHK